MPSWIAAPRSYLPRPPSSTCPGTAGLRPPGRRRPRAPGARSGRRLRAARRAGAGRGRRRPCACERNVSSRSNSERRAAAASNAICACCARWRLEHAHLLRIESRRHRFLVRLDGLIHRAVHLEQAAQVIRAAQRVDDGVGQLARDAGLALHLEPQLDERRVVVRQAREPQVRRHQVQPLRAARPARCAAP